MNDLQVRRWAGAFGLAGFVVFGGPTTPVSTLRADT